MNSIPSEYRIDENTAAKAAPRSLGLKAGLLLVGFALLVLLPGIHVSFTDRDEGNYAQVCRTMLETGDWLVPRHHGQPWLDKPPLLYWLATASFRAFGMGEWQARLVCVLASAASVLLTGLLGARLFNRRVGLIAGLLLATTGLFAIVGRMFLMDPILLTCLLAAVLLHWEIAERSRDREGAEEGSGFRVPGIARAVPSEIRNPKSEIHLLSALYWLTLGLGILAKGPTILPFAAGFGLALTRLPGGVKRWGGWRFWIWMPLALAVAAPWYVAMSHQAAQVMKDQFLLFGIVSRVIGTPDGHWGPPGYHLAHSLATLLPWTVFVPTAIAAAIRDRRRDPQLRLVLVWLIVPWLIVELMRSKLPHYVLPCYVPLLILVARQWDAALTAGKWPSATWAERWVPPVWSGAMCVLGVALVAASQYGQASPWNYPVLGLGLLMAIVFPIAGSHLRRGHIFPGLASGLAASAAFYVIAGLWLAPVVEPLRLSRNLAAAIDETAGPGDEILLCGYDEPSVFYYLSFQAHARPATVAEVSARLLKHDEPYVLAISQDRTEELDPPAHKAWLRHEAQNRLIRGHNYVKNQPTLIWIDRHTGPTTEPAP